MNTNVSLNSNFFLTKLGTAPSISKSFAPSATLHCAKTTSAEENKGKRGQSSSSKRNKRADHPLSKIVQIVNKPRQQVNHSYNDFSLVPAEASDVVLNDIEEMTFTQKVHHILSQDVYSKWISWLSHGRSFKVYLPAVFEREVLLKYFGHKRYSSFLRQLNNHGFKHVTKGNDRNSFYHECMLRGMSHLCKYMPKPRDARRLIPDPDNEPDFYQISKSFPLPDMRVMTFSSPQLNNNNSSDAVALYNHLASLSQPQQQPLFLTTSSNYRTVSDVSWLMDKLPEAKRMRMTTETPLPSSFTSIMCNKQQPLSLLRQPLQMQNEQQQQQQQRLFESHKMSQGFSSGQLYSNIQAQQQRINGSGGTSAYAAALLAAANRQQEKGIERFSASAAGQLTNTNQATTITANSMSADAIVAMLLRSRNLDTFNH